MTPMDEQGNKEPRVSADEDHVELQRTWFHYRDPIEKESRLEPVGTIVLLPGDVRDASHDCQWAGKILAESGVWRDPYAFATITLYAT